MPKNASVGKASKAGDYYLRSGFDLTKNNGEKEREFRENRILVERLRLSGDDSLSPLVKCFTKTPDKELLDRITQGLQQSIMRKLSNKNTMSSSQNQSTNTNNQTRNALTILPKDNMEETLNYYDDKMNELNRTDYEIQQRENRLAAKMMKVNETHKNMIIPKNTQFLTEDNGESNVIGSKFYWQDTYERSTYRNDMAGKLQHDLLKERFRGGRYGEITRQCDDPSGNAYIKVGAATRRRVPIDRSRKK